MWWESSWQHNDNKLRILSGILQHQFSDGLGVAGKQWASIAETHQKISKTDVCLIVEPEARFGLATYRLRSDCSTN